MLKNIGSNWALALIQIVVLIQLTPIQQAALGFGPNGAWLAVAALTGYLGLLILGIPMASVRFIAQHVAAKDTEKINEAISSCLGICLALGAGAIVIGGGISFFFEYTLRSPAWQALGPYWLREARLAYWISVITVGAGFVAQLPYGIMDAHNQFVASNSVKIVGLFLRLVLTVFVLRAYPTLVVIALIQTAAMVVEFALALIVVRRSCPGVRFDLARFDRSRVRQIVGFSVFVMLLNMGSQLSFRTDALVISWSLERANLDPTDITTFDNGNKFFPPLIGLVIGIAAVMMPTAAKLQAQGKIADLGPIFLKWSKIAYSLSLLVGVYLLVLGPEFVTWWVGPHFTVPAGQIIRVLMVSYLIFLPARGVAMPVLMGLGKAAKPSILFLVTGVANLIMSWILVKPLGIYGVAIGTAVPCVAFAVILIHLACQELGVSIVRFFVHVGGKTTLGAVPAALFLLWLKLYVHAFPEGRPRWIGFIPLALSGIGAVVVFGLTSIFFVYKNDPDVDLHGRMMRFVPKSLRGKA